MRFKLLLIILIISLIFLISCNKQNSVKDDIDCNSNLDCGVGGCSRQICGQKDEVKDAITTCEFKEEYECLKETSCLCIKNKCQWLENKDYLNCLEKIR